MRRQRIFVRGIVQGIGFRPFLYTLATKLGLTGFVSNHSDGVSIEIQGPSPAVLEFLNTLRTSPPPLAVIDDSSAEEIVPVAENGFRILESVSSPNTSTPVSPDIATCDDCLRELFDPLDRRFHYPFINCTNCGPRFTIIRDIPYDRPNTTMSSFTMCAECDAEYHSPDNRRFHAQPNACPVCGPAVWFEKDGGILREDAAIAATRAALIRGDIVAIKGIGGFHLSVDATNQAAVTRLRERKTRRHKPFALMARDLEIISQHASLGNIERQLLQSRQRPIVLLRREAESGLAESVAPGNPSVGFMLPYTPLHYLLLGDRPLVMTSGNLSEEPIVWRNEDARTRLKGIADAFLFHDRDIHVLCDDSVIAAFKDRELPIRRSRGYSPMPVMLPVQRPMTLAVGAELKACFCLTRNHYAYLSQHIGDMENIETLDAFERALDHMQALFRCHPERIVCDSHPGYLSTRWARTYAQKYSLPLIEVQHHHAHALSVMAEHGIAANAKVLTFAFDGTGYGTDGAIWGGEVLVASYESFQRCAHLKYTRLPGGDSAIRHPARVALAHLSAAGIEWTRDLPCVRACSSVELRILPKIPSVPSSSLGRLFDAVSAFLGLRANVTYEGQAAIELEAICSQIVARDLQPYQAIYGPGEFDLAPMWKEMIAERNPPLSAARFHRTVAQVILHYSRQARETLAIDTIALTGGVFQNTYLLNLACDLLSLEEFRVLTHRIVPPNDGGIAFGQATIL